MTVQEQLSDLEYDSDGMFITKHIDGGPVKVLDIRGQSTIVNSLGSENRAALFQDKVGRFVLEAINEKLENDKQKEKVWEKIQEDLADKGADFHLMVEKELNKKQNGNTNN